MLVQIIDPPLMAWAAVGIIFGGYLNYVFRWQPLELKSVSKAFLMLGLVHCRCSAYRHLLVYTTSSVGCFVHLQRH
jgi:hypothetical protein